MTDSILCDGCLMYQVIDGHNETLQIVNLNDSNETTHLCTDCSKLFRKWIETIEEKES